MSKPKIYYKVVDRDLRSAVISKKKIPVDVRERFTVKYKLNEWVRPNVEKTDLMVFATKAAAQDFIRFSIDDYKIFKCHAKNPRTRGLIIYWRELSENIINQFVKLRRNKKQIRTDVIPPKGTVFCSAVKLIEEI